MERRPAPVPSEHDREVEQVEEVVERLGRLALHAHALAERVGSLPPTAGPAGAARAERVARLRAAVVVLRHVLVRVAGQPPVLG